jgi:hypothetical protein
MMKRWKDYHFIFIGRDYFSIRVAWKKFDAVEKFVLVA